MIIDAAIIAAVLLGLALFACGLYALVRSAFLAWRMRRDRGPLDAALKRLGNNVKARNKKVAERIEDTF